MRREAASMHSMRTFQKGVHRIPAAGPERAATRGGQHCAEAGAASAGSDRSPPRSYHAASETSDQAGGAPANAGGPCRGGGAAAP